MGWVNSVCCSATTRPGKILDTIVRMTTADMVQQANLISRVKVICDGHVDNNDSETAVVNR